MKVVIPTPLRQYAGKQASIDVAARTVGEALDSITAKHPELRKHLFTEGGGLRAFVNVYLNDEDIRYLERKENTPVGESDTISIVPSIAGGNFTTQDTEDTEENRERARPFRLGAWCLVLGAEG
jgi:molybdopterin converting factor small subunit